MNGGIGYFSNYFLSYLFSFYPACSLQFILQWCAWLHSSHSSRHCFPLFGAVSWNWGRLLGWYGSFFLALTLCSRQQRCSKYFSPYALDQWSLDESVKLYMQCGSLMIFVSSDLVSQHAGIFHGYHIKTELKDFHIVNNDKAPHLNSLANSINPPFKYSHKDFYLPHIHFF